VQAEDGVEGLQHAAGAVAVAEGAPGLLDGGEGGLSAPAAGPLLRGPGQGLVQGLAVQPCPGHERDKVGTVMRTQLGVTLGNARKVCSAGPAPARRVASGRVWGPSSPSRAASSGTGPEILARARSTSGEPSPPRSRSGGTLGGTPPATDPEELLLASAPSCYMMTLARWPFGGSALQSRTRRSWARSRAQGPACTSTASACPAGRHRRHGRRPATRRSGAVRRRAGRLHRPDPAPGDSVHTGARRGRLTRCAGVARRPGPDGPLPHGHRFRPAGRLARPSVPTLQAKRRQGRSGASPWIATLHAAPSGCWMAHWYPRRRNSAQNLSGSLSNRAIRPGRPGTRRSVCKVRMPAWAGPTPRLSRSRRIR